MDAGSFGQNYFYSFKVNYKIAHSIPTRHTKPTSLNTFWIRLQHNGVCTEFFKPFQRKLFIFLNK